MGSTQVVYIQGSYKVLLSLATSHPHQNTSAITLPLIHG